MTWNYRIFRHEGARGTTFALHEAYYDKAGKLRDWTAEPVSPHRDTVDELIVMLGMFLRDAARSKNHVLNYETKKAAAARAKKSKATRRAF